MACGSCKSTSEQRRARSGQTSARREVPKALCDRSMQPAERKRKSRQQETSGGAAAVAATEAGASVAERDGEEGA
jgi:hypothetical protein